MYCKTSVFEIMKNRLSDVSDNPFYTWLAFSQVILLSQVKDNVHASGVWFKV